jgi:hypothetical protein
MTFGIFALGTFVWTIYGIVLHDAVIIASFAVGVVGSWLVVVLTFKYRFLGKRKHLSWVFFCI